MALIPKNLPKQFSDPIRFEPSVRMNGQVYINASHLVRSSLFRHSFEFEYVTYKYFDCFLLLTLQSADQSYEVEFEDRREEILNDISDEEMESIKETFQRYDIDGDGGISKPEMMQLIRDRSVERMAIISQKFEAFKAAEQEEMGQIKTEADAQLSRGLIKQQVQVELLVSMYVYVIFNVLPPLLLCLYFNLSAISANHVSGVRGHGSEHTGSRVGEGPARAAAARGTEQAAGSLRSRRRERGRHHLLQGVLPGRSLVAALRIEPGQEPSIRIA